MSLASRVRKVEPSELAESLNGLLVVGSRGCFWGAKSSNANSLYVRNPHIASPVFVDSLVASLVIRHWSTIVGVLLVRCWTKIFSPAIQRYAIDMICPFSANHLVHHYRGLLAFIESPSKGVKRFRGSEPSGAPLPLHQPFVIRGIDNHPQSSCKWNQAAINTVNLERERVFDGKINSIRMTLKVRIVLALLGFALHATYKIASSLGRCIGWFSATALAESLRYSLNGRRHDRVTSRSGVIRVLEHPTPLFYSFARVF